MPSDILDLVAPKALSLLGLSHRNYRFKEELYYRPDRATVIVRDATVVRYREGEGVAPHVDGKDATLLVYLNTCRGGGHTVFPEDGLAFPPRQGGALPRLRLDLRTTRRPCTRATRVDPPAAHRPRLPPGHGTMPLVDWDTGATVPGATDTTPRLPVRPLPGQ